MTQNENTNIFFGGNNSDTHTTAIAQHYAATLYKISAGVGPSRVSATVGADAMTSSDAANNY